MNHQEWLELAEFYALGTLDGDERDRFAAHLSAGCPQCKTRIKESEEALILAVGSLQPLAPPPEIKRRVFEQAESETPGFTFTYANEGQWQEIAPGIHAR